MKVTRVLGLLLAIGSIFVSCRTDSRRNFVGINSITTRYPLYALHVPRAYFGLAPISEKFYFVSGGFNKTQGYLDSTEIIQMNSDASVSPAALSAPSISVGPALQVKRAHHTSVQVPSTKEILMLGGIQEQFGSKMVLREVEVYNPVFNAISLKAPLVSARVFHTSTVLPDEQIFVLGGEDERGNAVPSSVAAELYDPRRDTSVAFAAASRTHHTATPLENGKVLIIGGLGANGKALASAELYDPQTKTFQPVSNPLSVSRQRHSAIAVKKAGETEVVLVVGGMSEDSLGRPTVLDSIEVYDVSKNQFIPSDQKLDDPVWGVTLSLINRSSNPEVVVSNGFRTVPQSSNFYLNQNLIASNENDLLIYQGFGSGQPSLSHVALGDSLVGFNGRGGHQSLSILNHLFHIGGISTECGINQNTLFCGGQDKADAIGAIEDVSLPSLAQLQGSFDALITLAIASLAAKEHGLYCLIDQKVYFETRVKDPERLVVEYDGDQIAFGLPNAAIHYYRDQKEFLFEGGHYDRDHELLFGIDHLHVSHDTSNIKDRSGIVIGSNDSLHTYPDTWEFNKRVAINGLPVLAGKYPKGVELNKATQRYETVLGGMLLSLENTNSGCAVLQDP
ncbi:MAG: hypothetical protein HYY62_04845 [Deltaproteobacteria bacterium]|nr:hypothetical protein [Deltaproteobacteria bacterium]